MMKTLGNKLFYWCLGMLMFCVPALESVSAARKPNILVIVGDDMGYADVGFTVAKIFLRRIWRHWRAAACGLLKIRW